MSAPVAYRTIEFGHRAPEEYSTFSNFTPSPIELAGRTWPTVEHYFQAQKFAAPEMAAHYDKIWKAETPAAAKRLGGSRQVPIRPDWDEVRDEVMRAALLAKFRTHAPLWALLDATGESPIVERTRHDTYWGVASNGVGLNRLGALLAEVRGVLRAEGA